MGRKKQRIRELEDALAFATEDVDKVAEAARKQIQELNQALTFWQREARGWQVKHDSLQKTLDRERADRKELESFISRNPKEDTIREQRDTIKRLSERLDWFERKHPVGGPSRAGMD